MDKKEIGRRIYMARIEKGWSQQELADKLVTSQARVSNMEQGTARIDVDYIQDIANVFNRSPYYFLLPSESAQEKMDLAYLIMTSLPPGPERDEGAACILDIAQGVERRVLERRGQ